MPSTIQQILRSRSLAAALALFALVLAAPRWCLAQGSSVRVYTVSEDRYSWSLRPGAIHRAGDRINSLGFRGAELLREKPAGQFRVVCLGDSVTEGGNVALRDTFPQLLEDLLQERGRQCKVINAGIGSHRALHGLWRLERDVISLDPDVVVIAYALNSAVLTNVNFYEEWQRTLVLKKAAVKSGKPFTRFRASLETRHAWQLRSSIPLKDFDGHLRGLVTQLKESTKAKIYLAAPSPVSEQYGHKTWNDETRRRQRILNQEYRFALKRVAKAMDCVAIDVYEAFLRSGKDIDELLADTAHPNRAGYQIWARTVGRQLVKDFPDRFGETND